MPKVWMTTFVRLAMVSAAGLIIGALYSQPLLGLLLAMLLALGWHLYWLFRLHRWISGAKMPFLPEGSGVWPQVFARIDFLRNRSRRRGKLYKALMKQMRQAISSFPDGGIILNSSNEILTTNEVARGMLGLKRKRDRGVRIENLLRDPDFLSYLHSDQYATAVEISSPINHGQWLACQLVPYGLEQKLLLLRDVTPQRAVEEMRRDFVANASHELRTPLTVITGYLDAFVDDASLAEDLQVPLAEMQRQASRMRALVDDLLKLSELEAADSFAADSRVDVGAAIAVATQEARALAGCPENIQMRLDSTAALLADSADVQSILTNLVTNAVRYTPVEGEIEISWSTDAAGGYLAVRDTGVGIGREHIPRLTERFFRVESGRERIGGAGGTGLGLAIVKHALARHDATLEISSELGVGTLCTCHFPRERIVTDA